MPLQTGPQPYRSNLLNEIKNRLGTFVPSGSTSVGAVLLKELLQNADDAGATELLVVLDHRDPPEGLAGGDLTAPGLLVANNGPFRDEHFDAITEVASGQKLADPAATGRFGVGFTSVYLVGDSCSLLSSQYLVVFDLLQRIMPHLGRLDGSNRMAQDRDAIWPIDLADDARAEWHGDLPRILAHSYLRGSISADLGKHSSVAKALACGDYDKIAAFRLPFRTGADEGLYSVQYSDRLARERLFADMAHAARPSLVFLRHIQTVRFAQLGPGGEVASGTVLSVTPWPPNASGFFNGLASGSGNHDSGVVERRISEEGIEVAEYRVRLLVKFPPDGEAARQDPFGKLRLGNRGWSKAVPVAGTAVATTGRVVKDEAWRVALPLIDPGPCGALLHGGFFLDQARRSPTFLRGVEGETLWNKLIVSKLVVPMLVDLLRNVSNPPSPDRESSIRLLESIPTFTSIDPDRADSLADFTAAEFHKQDWSLQLVDAAGQPFEFSRALLFPAGNAGGLIIQEVDELLADVLPLLPSAQSQRPIRYVDEQVCGAIRSRFPNAVKTWCRAATAIDAAALLSVLRHPEFPNNADQATVNGLVRRLADVERSDPQNAQLAGAFLFWSDRAPVRLEPAAFFVPRTTDASSAFREVIDVLGLGIEGLRRIDPGVGAADPEVAGRLGITNVHAPTDITLLRLLEEVAPSDNRHDRFEPEELARATAFWDVLHATAQRSPESIEKLQLAWTVCREGDSAEPLMNAVVVVHSPQWLDGHHQQLWDQLIEQAFPRPHETLANRHANIQGFFKQQRPTCFDMPGECEVVRTFPNELLGWASKLYWQRQNVDRQTRIIRAFAEVVEVLASRSPELGPDAFVAACSRFPFFTFEREFLRALPVHRLEDGTRTALYSPNAFGKQGHLAQMFRLKPSGQVAEPPGTERGFRLLDPPADLRSFYASTLGIPEHVGRLAVLDLLHQMQHPPPTREVHAARLKYLAANYWREYRAVEGVAERRSELAKALDEALLIPSSDGLYRKAIEAENARPVEAALHGLLNGGSQEQVRLLQAVASPKGVAATTDDEARDIGAMNVVLAPIEKADLTCRAVTSESTALTLRDRLRLLDAFHDGRHPLPRTDFAKVLLESLLPHLDGHHIPLAESELLPVDAFGLSLEVVGQFFPTAIDVGALSRDCGVSGERLREAVLPVLARQPLAFPTVAKRIRDGLAAHWSNLGAAAKLELLSEQEGEQPSRWGLRLDHLLDVVLRSLDGEAAAGQCLEIYRRAVSFITRCDRPEETPEELLDRIVLPCLDGSFHRGSACWFSNEIDAGVELESGGEYVVEATDEAIKFREWLEPDASRRFNLEELFPARSVAKPHNTQGQLPVAAQTWADLLGLIANRETVVGGRVHADAPGPRFQWALKATERMSVVYEGDQLCVRPTAEWPGPPVVADPSSGTLWLRLDTIPSVNAQAKLEEFDRRVARELSLALGIVRVDDRFGDLSESIRAELDRPGDELDRLRLRRVNRLIERYDELQADKEFSARRRSWDRLDHNSEAWRRTRDELRDMAKKGMLVARQRELEELGYSRASFFAEMAQNAEDACCQRDDLGMGEPRSRALTIRRVVDEIQIEHHGRPFNYWRHEGRSVEVFREDIDRITSDRGSFKQQTDGEAVTGRFGVGFKCVYWFTDRPRIHSHIWHFEIESTCIPHRVSPQGDLPEGATRLVLPLREDRRGERLPDAREAIDLILFTRKLCAVRLESPGVTRSLERREEAVGAASTGTIVSFTVDQQPLAQFLRIGSSAHQILIELDWNNRLPKRRDVAHADTFHTFPLAGEKHHLGVAVSAPFLLQSGRAHLAAAQSEDNAAQFQCLADLISRSGEVLRAAATRPGVARPSSWFEAFWLLWDFSAHSDSGLRGLRRVLARGLVDLAGNSDVVPRHDGEARSLLSAPASAFSEEIPLAFGTELAARAEEAGLADDHLPVARRYLVSAEVAAVLRAVSREALTAGSVVSLSWVRLKPLFTGQNSLFVTFPALLDRLAASLVLPGGASDEKRRPDAVEALRESHFASEPGEAHLPSEMWNRDWLEERDLPEFAYPLFRFPSSDYGDGALRLLKAAGLCTALNWDLFKEMMERCPDLDSAMGLLVFLDRTRAWKSWQTHRQTLCELRWIRSFLGYTSIRDCNLDLDRLSDEFREWLDADTSPPPLTAPPPRPPASAIIAAIREWWDEVAESETEHYVARLYPEGFEWPDFGSMRNSERRVAWLRFFILALSHTLGRSREEQHRNFLQRADDAGWLAVFSDPDATSDQWLQILDSYFEENVAGIPYYHWLRLFAPIRCISLYLDTYVGSFEDLARHIGDEDVSQFLNTATSVLYRGTTRLAPPATQVFGFGACFALRELRRQGIIENPQADRYCFTPKGSVRRAFERISGSEPDRHFSGSQQIARWLTQHNGGQLETFGDCFDLPFMVLHERHPYLLDEFLRSE